MTARSYRQTCHAARALDRVGERWTLLVVRELLTGPRRFKELMDALPGIGPNLLSQRLHDLAEADLTERVHLPPPADTGAWALTPAGEALEPVLLALVDFGRRLPGARRKKDHSRAGWDVLAAKALFDPEAADDLDCLYEIRVGDEVFCFEVGGGQLETWTGPARSPDVVLSTDAETWQQLTHAELRFPAAISEGVLQVQGDRRAARRFPSLFPSA
jgi:DNA-binding HxlR family transcriptional regulator